MEHLSTESAELSAMKFLLPAGCRVGSSENSNSSTTTNTNNHRPEPMLRGMYLLQAILLSSKTQLSTTTLSATYSNASIAGLELFAIVADAGAMRSITGGGGRGGGRQGEEGDSLSI